jgi:DNA-binding response OmpR family regulator
MNAIRAASYVLIVDNDADCIAAAVRGAGDALSVPTLVARSGDDAIRILEQFGAPAVLMAALALPDRAGLSVIESLHRIDENAAVIVWTTDRGLREYAASRLSHTRAKVLGRVLSPAVCRRCVAALLQGHDTQTAPTAPEVVDEIVVNELVAKELVAKEVVAVNDVEENWLELAERARQRLAVAGAAAYTRVRATAEYRWSVSWRPDAPIPDFPVVLPSAIEEVMASGVARRWSDLLDDSKPSSRDASCHTLRSLAIVPVLRGGGMAGALCAFDAEPDALGDEDLQTLTAVAGGAIARRQGPAVPMERGAAGAIIKRELARVSRDQQHLSVILFVVTAPRTDDLPSPGDMFATAVRGNDLVVRWTTSEVLVVLAGVCGVVAERVAERIRGAVETKAASRVSVSGVVTELRTIDAFEDAVASAAAKARQTPVLAPAANRVVARRSDRSTPREARGRTRL